MSWEWQQLGIRPGLREEEGLAGGGIVQGPGHASLLSTAGHPPTARLPEGPTVLAGDLGQGFHGGQLRVPGLVQSQSRPKRLLRGLCSQLGCPYAKSLEGWGQPCSCRGALQPHQVRSSLSLAGVAPPPLWGDLQGIHILADIPWPPRILQPHRHAPCPRGM